MNAVLFRWYWRNEKTCKFQQGKAIYVEELKKRIFYRSFSQNEVMRFCNGLVMDEHVLKWLRTEKIREIHFFRPESQTLLKTTVNTFFTKGIPREMNGHAQIILPLTYWKISTKSYKDPWVGKEVSVN